MYGFLDIYALIAHTLEIMILPYIVRIGDILYESGSILQYSLPVSLIGVEDHYLTELAVRQDVKGYYAGDWFDAVDEITEFHIEYLLL